MRNHGRSWKFAISLALFSALPHGLVHGGPVVDVALNASFSSPPYLLELLETAPEENPKAYFPLLDRIAEGYFDAASTDQELYTSFCRLLQDDGHLADDETLSSFKFALSIHSAAPRIEAHYQYYETSIKPLLEDSNVEECTTWAHHCGERYCSPGLESPDGFMSEAKSLLLPFDHVMGERGGVQSTILYSDITSPSFREFHHTLRASATSGKTSYRVRYKKPANTTDRPLVVNGYGVELALKRTDYIVIDDRQAEDEAAEPLQPAQAGLHEEDVSDLKPLSSAELSKLGLRGASFVLSSDDPFDTLLKLTQDFPKHSSSLTAHNVSAEFLAEHRGREDVLPGGYNVVWINGVQIPAQQMDAFNLLEHLRRERALIGSVRSLGFSGQEAIRLLSHPAIADAQNKDEPQRYDWRDDAEGGMVIMWLNNIEKDKRYADLPDDLSELLQRTYPGQLPAVRRDVHNLVLPVDFSDPKDVAMVVETLQPFVKRKIPIRFGMAPIANAPRAANQAKIAYHLHESYGLGALMDYLEVSLREKKFVLPDTKVFDHAIKSRNLRRDKTGMTLQQVIESIELDQRMKSAEEYLNRLGADGARTPVFINGVALPKNDEWMQTISNRVTLDLRSLQREIFEGKVADDEWIPDRFLTQAATRRNPLVIPEDESDIRVFNFYQLVCDNAATFESLPRLFAEDSANQAQWAHVLVVADFDSGPGFRLLSGAVNLAKEHAGLEIRLLHNSGNTPQAAGFSTRLFRLMSNGQDLPLNSVEELLRDKNASDDTDLRDELEQSVSFWGRHSPLVKALGLARGDEGILLDGRLVGPIPHLRPFSEEDWKTLLSYERKKRLHPTATALERLEFSDRVKTPLEAAKLSSVVALSMVPDIPEGIFEFTRQPRTGIFNMWNTSNTAITTGSVEEAGIEIVATIDPATEIAQRWVPIIKALSELDGIHVKLVLNPRSKVPELPVKRFYRHVLESQPSFNADGSLRSLHARFAGLPVEALLTMGMDLPPSWLVAPKECVYDLDNIKLNSVGSSDVMATYELENIIIEGHSRDVTTGMAPRGAQLILGTDKARSADTIIMANLGYFQFKANPGYFKLDLQDGRSKEVFNIDSAGTQGYTPQPGDEATEIALTSFQGVTLYPRLSRKVGKEDEDVLKPATSAVSDLASKGSEIANSVLSQVGLSDSAIGGKLSQAIGYVESLLSKKEPSALVNSSGHAEINIFSVASGHLYERMLNIMMVSVMRNTNHTVKFWFIEQFLSPSFKSFLPTMAAEYNFDYEMVTYKWPHWLRAQKEKQRVIWGYKILFLDVLFPLDLDKVIFVDADQIVRTDMYSLVTHNLKGAPYGFTPMCDSRTEMEGFRFWKQGYWKNFLQGLPYHISALYVVDLKRFRQLAAGDRLRQQYHQLSADPNSLSNLDQDLPNHLQVVIPIHSLPQEWLWCETWCSDESLKDAKTIDLCNNPLTKEPKLDRARRQVPEWTVYDEEIAALARRVRARNGANGGDEVVTEAPIAEVNDAAKERKEAEASDEKHTAKTRDEL